MNRKVQRSYILENDTMTSTTASDRSIKCKCGKHFNFGSLVIVHIEQGKCDLFPPSWAAPALKAALDSLFDRKRKEIREAKKGLRMDEESQSVAGVNVGSPYGSMTPTSLRMAKLEQEMSFYHAFNDQNSAIWRPIPGRGAGKGMDKNEATEKCLSTIPEYMGRQQVMNREMAVNTSHSHEASFFLNQKMQMPNLEAIWAHAHDPSMSPSSVTGPMTKTEPDETFQKKRQHSIARTSTMLFAGNHGSLPASMTKGPNKLNAANLPFNSTTTITTITSPATTEKPNHTNYYNTFPRMVKFGNGDRSIHSINSKDAEMLSAKVSHKSSSASLRPSTPMNLPPPARPPPPIPSYSLQRPHSSPHHGHVHTSLPTPPSSRHSRDPPTTQFLLFPLRKKEPLRSPMGTRVSPTKEEMLAGGLFKGDRGFFIDGDHNSKSREKRNFKWRWKKKGMKDDEQETVKEEELEKMLDSWVLLDPRR